MIRFSWPLYFFMMFGCKSGNNAGKLSEGIIEYKVEYTSDSSKAGSTQFLPRTMTLKFRNTLSVNKISGFFGLFEISNYADSRKKTNITCLKLLDNKYSFSSNEDQPLCCFDPFNGMTIQFVEGETMLIAGFSCNKAIAHFPGNEHNDFDIYYTTDIKVKSPNMYNPFHDIKGVLMQFSLKMKNLNMRIKADSVKSTKISSSDFEVPMGYKAISKEKMEEYLYTLLD